MKDDAHTSTAGAQGAQGWPDDWDRPALPVAAQPRAGRLDEIIRSAEAGAAEVGPLAGPVRAGQQKFSRRLDELEAARQASAETPRSQPRREPREGEPARYELEVLGPPTAAQIGWLIEQRRITRAETLESVGARHVRVRFFDRETEAWRTWWPYVGLPTLAGGAKLWSPQTDGRLFRANAGRVSIIASPDLRVSNPGPIERLWDLEGESDAVAAVDAGLGGVISTTGGAGSLAGHQRHADWLRALEPGLVVVVRDRDEAGRRGAERALAWWRDFGVPVRILALPAELGEGGDLRDYLLGRRPTAGRVTLDPLGGPAELLALLGGL